MQLDTTFRPGAVVRVKPLEACDRSPAHTHNRVLETLNKAHPDLAGSIGRVTSVKPDKAGDGHVFGVAIPWTTIHEGIQHCTWGDYFAAHELELVK